MKLERTNFLHLIAEAHENYEAEDAFYDLISDACVDLLRNYQSLSVDPQQFTLQQFYTPETLFFKLVGASNILTHVPWHKDRPDPIGLMPLIELSSIPDASEVSCFDASRITILPRYSSNASDVLSDKQGTVVITWATTRYHFKAAGDHTSFIRELKLLLQLQQNNLTQNHRLPSIHGLVHYHKEPQLVIGVLLGS
jgi:hypothetical protein